MSDLVIQGPDASFELAQQLARISGATEVVPLRLNAYRLRSIRSVETAIDRCVNLKIDTALVPAERRLGDFGLIAMDMDSTLISIECIDEIADMAGIKPQVAAITEQAMRGEIDFPQSLRSRVALLKGLPLGALNKVYRERLKLSPGAEEFLVGAKKSHLKTLLVSGGFTFFVGRLQQRLKLDYTRSNLLEVRGGKLTGNLVGEVFDARAKADALAEISEQLRLNKNQTIAIGDGANDLPMLAAAGVSIAYHAKPVVQEQADYALNHVGLDGVLNLFL